MIYLLYGAVGVLAVLMLLLTGGFLGWKINDALRKYHGKRAAEEITQQQRRQLVAQQKAFEEMLGYNQDTAYGMAAGLEAIQGGDEV